MVRHIVMFKLKEFASPAEKQAKLDEIKTRLEALIDKIDVLRKIEVKFNCNPEESWDLILITELDSLADVSTYANHPEHVAVAKGIIGPVKADRACVDYEM
ncbi:Dabb family protein [Parabacteroides sp. AD58]|uniref:Dabb family protein n=1 Tax=Parabacteroides absconsus TaxID=2951805 RepID=A0ABZ2ISF4_9BACT|nr:Dabb family protein [Parabacteroides sp. AD58]MCM6900935.1 Dabb family protein [Parabacteroides sp. AD58]